jgi:hypothetical protein
LFTTYESFLAIPLNVKEFVVIKSIPNKHVSVRFGIT